MDEVEAIDQVKGQDRYPADRNDRTDVRAVAMVDTLREFHELELLKARYCRTLDTKDWSGFRGVFTEDFVSDTAESGGKVTNGVDEFIDFVSRNLAKCVTVHQVQQPELELTSPTDARGIWAMQDVVRLAPGLTLHGFGHYVETYVKVDGEWRIKSSKLTRLREQIQTPILTIFISDRIRRGLQRAARRRAR